MAAEYDEHLEIMVERDAEIKRLRKVMGNQALELMGAEIDLRRDGKDKISFDTLNRVINALVEEQE